MEDPAIAYDSLRFLDFEALDMPAGIVQFTRGDEQLVVININRNKLESTHGADLIYLNEQLGGFVFVQYKTMRHSLGGKPAFRGDANTEQELALMRQIELGEDDGSARSFRLDPRCTFVKLCSPVTHLRQRDKGPIAGLYLPVSYLDVVLKEGLGHGPRAGLALNYDTVPRYMTNTQFAELVRGGWIGTRGRATEDLMKTIIAAQSPRRSVTLAVKSTLPGRQPEPRRRAPRRG